MSISSYVVVADTVLDTTGPVAGTNTIEINNIYGDHPAKIKEISGIRKNNIDLRSYERQQPRLRSYDIEDDGEGGGEDFKKDDAGMMETNYQEWHYTSDFI